MRSNSVDGPTRPARNRGRVWIGAIAAALLALTALPASAQISYVQENLVASTAGYGATFINPNLVNPWGMSRSGTSPWWVSNNGTGVSTLHNGQGVAQALVVTIPSVVGNPTSLPTGQVFNGGADFALPTGGAARFIFATIEGTIAAWNGAQGTNALVQVNNNGSSVYTGLALGNNGSANFLYAADFAAGQIDVFDANYSATTLAGGFVDPGLPGGYAPFNVQNIGGQLFVAYALQGVGEEQPGPGLGIVNVFDTNGNFIRRFATGTPVGPLSDLNAPWGFAQAPADFGPMSNALLVGQFGNGKILAFDPVTANFLGALSGFDNQPLVIDGLWGIGFGNGAAAGPTNALYFAAGPNDEADGLFGRILAVAAPEPGSLSLLGLAMAAGIPFLRRRRG